MIRTKPFQCPWCASIHTAVTGVNADVPDAGSISICFECGCASVFMEDGQLRKPTAIEEQEIAADPLVQAAQYQHAFMRSKRAQ
jgi:hypothetical protein